MVNPQSLTAPIRLLNPCCLTFHSVIQRCANSQLRQNRKPETNNHQVKAVSIPTKTTRCLTTIRRFTSQNIELDLPVPEYNFEKEVDQTNTPDIGNTQRHNADQSEPQVVKIIGSDAADAGTTGTSQSARASLDKPFNLLSSLDDLPTPSRDAKKADKRKSLLVSPTIPSTGHKTVEKSETRTAGRHRVRSTDKAWANPNTASVSTETQTESDGAAETTVPPSLEPASITVKSQSSTDVTSNIVPIPVYIVGGSGTIGAAIARAFASHPLYPFHITIIGRDRDKMSAVLKTLDKPANASWPHAAMQATMGIYASWATFWQERKWTIAPKEDESVVPAILVNCAGKVYRRLLIDTAHPHIEPLTNINLHGPLIASRAFGSRQAMKMRRKLLKAGGHAGFTPSIINIGSLLGQQGGLGAVSYATTKAGLMGLTRSLAAEYGRLGIRVNAVNPGFVDSPMAMEEGEVRLNAIKKRIPIGRLARPEEVADAVVFLALNNYANNCVINLDGGLSAVGPADDLLESNDADDTIRKIGNAVDQ